MFNRQDLAHFEGFGVPDLLGEDCRLLIVGINPGLWTAAAGVHFAHPTNRFWPAMRRAGLVEVEPNIRPPAPSVPIVEPDYLGQPPSELWTAATYTDSCHPSNRFSPALRAAGLIEWRIDTSVGMSDEERERLAATGVGITNLVPRATARASELTAAELREGAIRLHRLVADVSPAVVAVAGLTAYRTAFERPKAVLGRQPETIDDAKLWVVPNPSGLNAHETIDTLAVRYRSVAEAAGLL
ncbi:MAG: mismatch-specific DNA-glycosylase [Acidimicrobiia bacterium]